MAKRYWMMKTEPEAYGWSDLVRDGETLWDGVRNHRAAANLRAMRVGEQALLYHSVSDKAVVGIVEISAAGLPDPKDPAWAAVKIKPVKALTRPVTLAEIKATPELAECELVRLSRLSVAELRLEEWNKIVSLSKG
jgi:predicted RNA-binding protein with PUA-like domain